VEIMGPIIANFHHMFAENGGNFLGVLLGRYSVVEFNESTDLASKTEKSFKSAVVENMVRMNVNEIVDLHAGALNVENLEKIEIEQSLKVLGVLRYGKLLNVDMPSFMDRKIMTALKSSSLYEQGKYFTYILVGEEVTDKILSLKFNMTSYLISRCENEDGPWSRKVPLLIPNLGTGHRVEYMAGGAAGSLQDTVLKDLLIDVRESFQPLYVKFGESFNTRSVRFLDLSMKRAGLQKDVVKLLKLLNQNLEKSEEFTYLRSLEGGLLDALNVLQEKKRVRVKTLLEDNIQSLKLELSDSEDML